MVLAVIILNLSTKFHFFRSAFFINCFLSQNFVFYYVDVLKIPSILEMHFFQETENLKSKLKKKNYSIFFFLNPLFKQYKRWVSSFIHVVFLVRWIGSGTQHPFLFPSTDDSLTWMKMCINAEICSINGAYEGMNYMFNGSFMWLTFDALKAYRFRYPDFPSQNDLTVKEGTDATCSLSVLFRVTAGIVTNCISLPWRCSLRAVGPTEVDGQVTGKHARDVLQQASACDVSISFDRAAAEERQQQATVDLCRRQQNVSCKTRSKCVTWIIETTAAVN